MHQVAIIGAGPAGTIAAILLARAGVDVALIEQHRFPRDKVCGECLSATGIGVLGRLRLSPGVQTLHPRILTQTILHAKGGHSVRIRLPRPMWGISRQSLDQFLLNSAIAAGARILQPARCESIDVRNRPRMRVRMLESNELREMDVAWIIIADGKGSSMSSAPVATDDLGLKAHFTGVNAPEDAIELFGVEGHYGGAAPVEDGLWNIAFSVPKSRVKACAGDLDGLFASILLENGSLRQRMAGARRVGDWLLSPLPRFGVAERWPAGAIPIGNAAAALEPIGGEGMGLAMRSAELAADAIIHATRTNTPVDSAALRRAYRKLWLVRRYACRAAARIFSSPPLARLGVGFARANAAATLALRLVGK